MTKVKALLVGLIVAAFAFVGFNLVTGDSLLAVSTAADCTSGAVIYCGVASESVLIDKYNANATGDLPQIYGRYGITGDMIRSRSAAVGTVTKDGNVYIGNQLVATGAGTVGRLGYSGDNTFQINGKTFYEHSTQRSFLSNSISALVYMDGNGRFVGAILNSCGNPVYATPVKPAPKPAAYCDSLTVTPLSRTKFRLTGAAHGVDGATVSAIHYYAFDKAGNPVQGIPANGASSSVEMTLTPGTYTMRAFAITSVGNVTSDACAKPLTVQQEMCPVPGKENLPKDSPDCYVPKPIQVCDLGSSKIITIDEHDFDAKKHSKNLADCRMQVCDLKTNTVITIDKEKFDSTKHSTKLTDCEKTTVCEIATGKIITIYRNQMDDKKYSTNLDDCRIKVCDLTTHEMITIDKEKYDASKHGTAADCAPVVPQLPKTGLGDAFSGSLGLGALTTAGYYYFASRRALGDR